jgi:hypothetical protein
VRDVTFTTDAVGRPVLGSHAALQDATEVLITVRDGVKCYVAVESALEDAA